VLLQRPNDSKKKKEEEVNMKNLKSHARSEPLACIFRAMQLSALLPFNHIIIILQWVSFLIHGIQHPSSVTSHNMLKGSNPQTY
jgi:hypothetical protein